MRIEKCAFKIGELYLFHPSDPACRPETSLWGVFDRRAGMNAVWLEVSSCDLIHFRLGGTLPVRFRFCRRASRFELRDFAFLLGVDSQRRVFP